MAQAPRPVKITPVGYDDPFAEEKPRVKITAVGYDDPFKAPPPPRTPGFLEDVDRGLTGLATTFDLLGYGAQQGARKVFGGDNVDRVDSFFQKHLGMPLVGNEFTPALVEDVHQLNTMPKNPVMAEAGQAYGKAPSTLAGIIAGGKVIASNPSVIPHILAESLPSLPIGGAGGKVATKLAAPIAERVALKVGEKAAQAATVGAFGAGMNTTMTVANAGQNVAAQEADNPSAPGTIAPENVATGVKQTAGQIPGAMAAGALLPLGTSRFASPAVNVGARVLTQSIVQGGGNVASVAGGNAAIGKDSTPEELFAAGAGGLVTGPADLAGSAFHARGAAFDKLMGEFAKRTGGPDISAHQFGDVPHPTDGGFHETADGVVADEAGNPVAFADHKAAARFAAGNDLGGSHELAIASDADGGTKVVLRRRQAAPVQARPVKGDPFANEPDAPAHLPVEGNPFAGEPATKPPEASAPSSPPVAEPQPVAGGPAAAGGDGLRPASSDLPAPPVLHSDLRPEPGELADGEHYVTTPAGARIRSRYEVVPAASLLPAEGDLQNRDRSRDTTDLQVQDIVSGFDPSRLAASAETDRGSPIVGHDHVVESGNGRMLAINRIYGDPANAQKAAAYRDYLESQGHSTEGVENPVLIRRRMTDMSPEQRRQFVIDSNKDTKLALTSVERARSDADALDSHALEQFRGGDVASAGNAEFVKTFIGRMAKPEQAAMADGDRNLSQDGITRIENALMARAYENPAVLSKLIEARDNNIRSIGAGMLDNAGGWAKLRAGVKDGTVKPEFDITDQLVEAARRVSDIRAKGAKIGDELSQSSLFPAKGDTALVESFMRAFYNPELSRAASREAITDLIGSYARRASEQTTAPRLFGGDDTSPGEILQTLLDARRDKAGDMFSIAAERAPKPANDDWLGDDIENSLAARRDRRMARQGLNMETADDTHRTPQRDEGAHQGASRQGQEARAEERGGRGSGGSDATGKGGDASPSRVQAGGGSDAATGEAVDYTEGRSPTLFDVSPYEPSFQTASFTSRASIFNSAAQALGIDPDKFTLMPAPRQVSLLRDAIKLKFGVEVIVDRGMQERFAIDQMLDAYQNVQGMAHVLDLPNKAVSLNGALKLKLQKSGNFLGAFQPGTNMIMLPQRSNSFAHEWGHALDWHLLGLAGEDGHGLTGAIRKRGKDVDPLNFGVPQNVREAFVDLLNAMFFDKADVAHRIMTLEAKIAATDSAKVKAASQLAIDKLKGGNSQVRDLRSAFYKNAKDFDGAGNDYWQSPTEMFARAFEAYVSYKVEAAGLTTEFIGKGDAAYLSNAEERFAKTFPKGDERANIFAAFEQVFGHLADEQTLGKGAGAAKPEGTVRRITDYDKTPKVAKEKGVINRELSAIKAQLRQRKKEIADRPDDAKGVIEKAADLNGATFMSMTGNLRMIQARSGSKALQKLIDLLTKQDGRGDRTVARTFAEDVHLQSKAAVNRLANIMRANYLEGLDAEDTMILRDLLIGARADAPPGMGHLVKGASAIRHLLDNEFYVNQQAGIDLGYTRNGYLARVLDLPKVYGDQPGFVRQAAKVYGHVFDNTFGTDSEELRAKTEDDTPAGFAKKGDTLPAFMKMARQLAKGGADLPSLQPVRDLMKQIKQLAAKAAEAEDPGPILAKMAKLDEELADTFADLFGEVRPAFMKERAEAWLAKINLVAGQEHNASSPDSKYTKHRELPPEADKIMEKYYLADPVESVTNYLVTSARRTAYARRFGADGAKRAALFERMAAEGVSPDDQRTVERILDTATGRMRSQLPKVVQQTAAFVNAAGTMALLPRAVISSLAEPFQAGLVTGDALDGFRMMAKQISGALGTPSGKVRFELARAMGIISDVASDDIMEARYGQTYADTTRWDRYTAAMFRRTGLTALTRAQKTAGVGLAHAWLDNLSGKVLNGKGTAKDQAIALMRELGIRDPEAFAKELLATGRLPTPEELDSAYGHDYATAQLRFSQMVIQEPGGMDRPELSQNPVGRVIYGITGFSYGYWRNIIKRNGILLAETGRRRGSSRAALYGGALFASAAIAFLMGAIVSTVRERLLNPKRWHELEAKHDGSLETQMGQLAFTRVFSFGAADTAIQTWSGLKYQRDLSNIFVGPGVGFMLQNAQKMAQPLVSNSRKTNTAEYSAVQGAYSAASPFLAFGLARIPGGALIGTATGAGMAYVTSPAARDAFATAVVGPKNGSPGPDGKKVKSGPTALDRSLDGVFGPVGKKSKATANPYLH